MHELEMRKLELRENSDLSVLVSDIGDALSPIADRVGAQVRSFEQRCTDEYNAAFRKHRNEVARPYFEDHVVNKLDLLYLPGALHNRGPEGFVDTQWFRDLEQEEYLRLLDEDSALLEGVTCSEMVRDLAGILQKQKKRPSVANVRAILRDKLEFDHPSDKSLAMDLAEQWRKYVFVETFRRLLNSQATGDELPQFRVDVHAWAPPHVCNAPPRYPLPLETLIDDPPWQHKVAVLVALHDYLVIGAPIASSAYRTSQARRGNEHLDMLVDRIASFGGPRWIPQLRRWLQEVVSRFEAVETAKTARASSTVDEGPPRVDSEVASEDGVAADKATDLPLDEPDGPCIPFTWRCNGKIVQGKLQPKPWELVNFLWQKQNRSARFYELAELLNDDEIDTPEATQMGSLRRQANRFFKGNGIRLKVRTKSSVVFLEGK